MKGKIEYSQWLVDLADLGSIEKKLLDDCYKHLKEVLPDYMDSGPTPEPLDFDIKLCEDKEEHMSKSLDFCVKRASDPACSGFSDRDWRKAKEICSEAIINGATKGLREWHLKWRDEKSGEENLLTVDLEIDPDGDFTYFTSSTSVNDGTLLFLNEHLEDCANKILLARTYDVNLKVPEAGDAIKYTVGNFVILLEYDEDGSKFAPKDKPWMTERMTVLLPIKYEVISEAHNEEM